MSYEREYYHECHCCGHYWKSHYRNPAPKICPHCKNPNWNIGRINFRGAKKRISPHQKQYWPGDR